MIPESFWAGRLFHNICHKLPFSFQIKESQDEQKLEQK